MAFSRRAWLGVLAVGVQPWLFALRAGEFTQSISHVQVAGLIPMAMFGINSSAIDMGLVLVFAAMIAASVFKTETSSAKPCRYLQYLSGVGWVVFFSLELFLSAMSTNGPWQKQVTAVGVALAMMLFETMSGILVLEHTLPEARHLAMNLAGAIARGFGWSNAKPNDGSGSSAS